MNLIKKKLVAKFDEDKTKKYRVKYYITQEGLDVYNEIVSIIGHICHKCVEGCSKEEIDTFYKVLGVIMGNFSEFYSRIDNEG